MENEELFGVQQFCTFHNVEVSFLEDLNESELIHFTIVNEEYFLSPAELVQAEKFTRLHTELGINSAGLDAISHLLDQMTEMRQELQRLRNRLQFYDNEV